MTLLLGARLGPYEIVSAIGAAGMGEVFVVTLTVRFAMQITVV